jgi:glycosyltransferase involved in cell wall biosynthesis
MRILFPVHNAILHAAGGTELYTAGISRQMAKLHDVAIVYPIYAPDAPNLVLKHHIDAHGVHIYQIHGAPHGLVIGFGDGLPVQAEFMARLGEVLDSFTPDVVHIQHLLGYPLLSVLDEFRARHLPVLMTLHDHWLLCPKIHYLRADLKPCEGPAFGLWTCAACIAGRLPLRLANPMLAVPHYTGILRLAGRLLPRHSMPGLLLRRSRIIQDALSKINLFLAPSRSHAERMVGAGLPPERVRVLPLAHNTPRNLSPHKPHSDTEPLHVGFLGTFAPGKGVHILLGAADLLAREAPGAFAFRLYGYGRDGVYTRNIETWAARLPNVRVMGRYRLDELSEIFAGLDCIVLPSLWYETFSFVISEAFLHGVPVVASDLGAMTERIETGGGLLFEPGSRRALAGVLRRLQNTPGLLAKLRETIPLVPKLEAHVQKLLDLYSAYLPE